MRKIKIKSIVWVALVLIMLASSGGWGREDSTAATEPRRIQTVPPGEVKRWMAEGRLFELIDVRVPEEFARKRLIGARNVPFYEISQAALPKDRSLVLYCSQKNCSLSPDSAAALLSRGYKDIRVLEGGIEGAVDQGLAAESFARAQPDAEGCLLSGKDLEKGLGQSRPPHVIDLRPELEFKAGHIPNALDIPLERLSAVAADLPRDRQLVVYDRLPERSGRGASILKDSGMRPCELRGGISLWIYEKRPLQ